MKKMLSTKACMAGFLAAVFFALFALTTATSAPVVVIPGEGAGYIYYSAGGSGAPATPAEDDSNVGMVAAFFFTPPADTWVVCDGQTVFAAAYPKLVKALTGSDTATSAVVPNLQGYFLRGANPTMAGLDPNRTVGSSQGDAMRNFTGDIWVGWGGHISANGVFQHVNSIGINVVAEKWGGWTSYIYRLNPSLAVPTANENRPHNIAVIYAMRAK